MKCARLARLSLLAASLALANRVFAVSPNDPYAIDPFRVVQRTAPTDPLKRWEGFASRVGTYLPTDAYHWWRFNVKNRAEAQEAYLNITAVADLERPAWTGSYPLNPGEVRQAWRDAFMRCVNLQRYYYMGAAATYVEEDADPVRRHGLQAAAFIESQRPVRYSHNLTAADMPLGFLWHDEAIYWAARSCIGQTMFPSDIHGFIADAQNPYPGHRLDALNPGADLFVISRAGPNDRAEREASTSAWETTLFFSADKTTMVYEGPFAGNAKQDSVPPPPRYDPFDGPLVYPFAGFVAVDDFEGLGCPASVEFDGAGLILDPSEIRVSVTRDGLPVPVTDIQVGLAPGWRQVVAFSPQWGEFRFRAPDSTVTISISGLKFRRDLCGFPPRQGWTTATYIAASDHRCFEPHTITWSFTVFDPLLTPTLSPPASRSELVNLSTRAGIGADGKELIAGFIVSGNEPLRIAIRAQGPGLAQHGIHHPAIDPAITLYQLGVGGTRLGGNESWKESAHWRLAQSYGLQPNSAQEAVCIATLMPGAYSAVVTDAVSSSPGVGIVEVFALDAESASRLINVSTRAFLGTGELALIGGFTLQTESTLLIRTQSPSLKAYGLPGVVGTKLTVVRQSDHATIATNVGWSANGSVGNERLRGDLSRLAPSSPLEAAQVLRLPAGAYSAVVESADGSTGVGIVEVFHVE